MGTMTNILSEISTLFSSAQETAACHQKNSLGLTKIYRKSDFDKFFEAFVCFVDSILQVDFKENSLYVQKLIDFLGVFCGSLKGQHKINNELEESFTEDPLIMKLFEHLLQASQCSSDTIRFRSCEIINRILDYLVGNDISTDLCEQLQETLVNLLSDSKHKIRLQAVVALHRLQDPTDPNDIIIKELIQLIYDTHAKVRQLCVEKIAIRQDVIEHILKRTRDVDMNVRLAAFKRLTKFVKCIKIDDRRNLLHTGMFDPSEKVQQFFTTYFLNSWWESYDKNIIRLMKSIRLDADENDIKRTMDLYTNILTKFFFKTRTLNELHEVLILNEEKLIPYSELNWETISYWKLFVIHLSQNEETENELINVIPELIVFCQYIKGYTDYSNDCTGEEFLEKQNIIKQLFLITRTYDLADPVGRKSLNKLVKFVLKNVDLMDEVVEAIVGTLELTMPEPNSRSQFACEIISGLLYPVDTEDELKKHHENEFSLSKLKVKLNCLREEQDAAVANANYMEAEKLKYQIEEISFQINNLKNSILISDEENIQRTTDLAALLKCLDIAWAMLRTAKITSLTPSLKDLKNGFIAEMLVHENEIVRMKALRCYAICCLYDKPSARNGIHIFAVPITAYQAGEECDTQTLVICISAISDLIRIYGADLLAEPNEDQLSESVDEEHQKVFTGGTSLTSMIQGLVDLMDDEQYEIQLTASQGLCKLVLDERISSSPLISRLILKWCHPTDKDEPESESLKQFIGYVLEKIPHLPNSTEQLEGAVLLTVNTLVKAPRASPLAQVDIDNIVKFLLALCKVSSKGKHIHSNLAFSICQKIDKAPNSKLNSTFSKMLLMLDIPDDNIIREELIKLCEVAKENISDKMVLKNLTKYMANLMERSKDMKSTPVFPEEAEKLFGTTSISST